MGRIDEAHIILEKTAGSSFASLEMSSIRESLMGEKERGGGFLKKTSCTSIDRYFSGCTTAGDRHQCIYVFRRHDFQDHEQSSGVDAGLLQQIVINGACTLFTLVAIATVDKWDGKPLMIIVRLEWNKPDRDGFDGTDNEGPHSGK